ncbi:Aste57867_8804 [Aphanomyces stellatus]|uniref:Aste57867_8804 protein n=1 Tax=Aphanomyces stellatus TaxID=120398 RepID=A0A485KLI8_9STRA|nr:hypothetical protein As57867_008769 [Aphanomyces stellatus]VFT85690.1 Aste57867_8804 [Aphanomyces stellatus]
MLRRASLSTGRTFQRREFDMLQPSHWVPATIADQATLERAMYARLANLPSKIVGVPWGWNKDDKAKADKEFFEDLPTEFQVKDVPMAYGIATYAYSSAFIVDEEGKHAQSIRRRYEDSTGRLKAMHSRKVEGITMTSQWDRVRRGDEGSYSASVTKGTVAEFKETWRRTPFGQLGVKIETEGTSVG